MVSGNGIVLATLESRELSIGQVLRVPIARIRPFVGQPREHFDQASLAALAQSLKGGQEVPIIVKRISDDPDHDYEITDGERRYRAALIAKLEHIMVWVKDIESVDAQFVSSVISNFGRADHTSLEKAKALSRLVQMGMSIEEVAERCGYTRGWVDQHLSLLRLVPEVQALMSPDRPREKQLTFSSAIKMVSLPPSLQRELAENLAHKKIKHSEVRFVVQAKAHESGTRIKTRGRSSSKDFAIIGGFATRVAEQSRLIMTTPDDIFAGAMRSQSVEVVDRAVADLKLAIGTLQKMITKIQQSRRAGVE